MLADRLDWLRVVSASNHPELFDLKDITSK
jgi:hypothetical protein